MSKHTPGPWSVSNGKVMSEYAIRAECRGDDFGSSVAIVTQREGQNPLPHDEAMANARLIAAAPELLEALKAMVSLDEDEHQRGPGDIDICKEVQDAYAAIAKATGGTR